MRLWSVVVSQPAKRPSYQAGGTGMVSVLTDTAAPEARLEVAQQVVRQRRIPRLAGGGRPRAAVAEQLAERDGILEGLARRDRGPDQALAVQPVARRARPLKGFLSLVQLDVLRPRQDLYDASHRGVLDAAELGAPDRVRAGLLGLEPRVIGLAGNRVRLAAERWHRPAVRDVEGDDVELDH